MKIARLALLATTCLLPAGAQHSGDPEFAAPAPRTCAAHNLPKTGGLTAAQAREYFICGNEKYIRTFSQRAAYLLSNVNIEVGKGRPFNILTDSYQDIDPSQTVYPIRGSFIAWHCYAPKPDVGPDNFPVPTQGRNCTKSEAKAATGISYKDSFGDWHTMLCCEGHAISETKWMISYFPPPPENR